MRGCRRVVDCIVICMLALALPCRQARCADATAFPTKPIRIIVYMGPGGLIDVTARKFTEIAAKYRRDATFVVENKPGAGGLVAMKQVLQLPADGYTLFACTKSNISSIVSGGRESYLDQFDWIAMLMADPECMIIRRDTSLNTWDAVVEDGRAKQGRQIWVGPDVGGLDHVMALKTWDRFGLSGKWIPFESGGAAVTALLGDQGVAYVGNPRDTLGNPDQLKIAIVSSPERLEMFPDVPTFKEYGIEGMDRESMWRGFAIQAGSPPEALKWYDELFQQVANDANWREFWEKGGIDVEYRGASEFTAAVKDDAKEFAFYLNRIGLVRSRADHGFASLFQGTSVLWIVAALFVANGLLAIALVGMGYGHRLGSFMIPAFVISASLLLLAMTLPFPRIDDVGAATVPRLWTCILIPLGVCLLISAARNRTELPKERTRTDLVWKFSLLVAAYVAAVTYFGYFPSSFVFLYASMHALGVRRLAVKLLVPAGWLLVSYWVFVRILFIPLPTGQLLERFF